MTQKFHPNINTYVDSPVACTRNFTAASYEKVKESESEVAQWCLSLCDPVDCSLPGSSIRGILQARILEWVAISFSSIIWEPASKCLSTGEWIHKVYSFNSRLHSYENEQTTTTGSNVEETQTPGWVKAVRHKRLNALWLLLYKVQKHTPNLWQ